MLGRERLNSSKIVDSHCYCLLSGLCVRKFNTPYYHASLEITTSLVALASVYGGVGEGGHFLLFSKLTVYES